MSSGMSADCRRGRARPATYHGCRLVDGDTVNGRAEAIAGVELVVSPGDSEVLSVRGFLAISGEAWLLDEGFNQDPAVCILCAPAFGHASDGARQELQDEIQTS